MKIINRKNNWLLLKRPIILYSFKEERIINPVQFQDQQFAVKHLNEQTYPVC